MPIGDDLITNCQPHASATSNRLGCKEGVKDFLFDSFWNAVAVIPNSDLDPSLVDETRINRDCGSNFLSILDRDFNGVYGVRYDVHKNLIERSRIALHQGKRT